MIDCCIQKTEKKVWSDCSLIEIKKKHTKKVTDQTATCFPFWEIWLVNLKYTCSCCHCIISICLQVSTYLKSLVSLIYCGLDPFEVKMLHNLAYTKEIIALHAWAVGWVVSDYSHYGKINTQSQWWTNQYTFSMLFSRADLRESMVFYGFFSQPMFARMFSLLVYLRGQCSSLKQEHLSYLFIDSL